MKSQHIQIKKQPWHEAAYDVTCKHGYSKACETGIKYGSGRRILTEAQRKITGALIRTERHEELHGILS